MTHPLPTNDLDDRVRTAAHGIVHLDAATRERIWDRAGVGAVEIRRTARRRQVRPHHTALRIALVASVVVLGISGAALATGTNVVERIFGDDTPAIERIDQFAKPAPKVTQAEYQELANMRMVPGVKRIGIIKDSEMVEKFPLAPYDDARVLVDDPRFGRIVGLASTDGKTLCIITKLAPSEDGVGGNGTCGEFDSAGLMAGYSFMFRGDRPQFGFSGIAADDVQAITLTFADGSTENVPLVQNAFRWFGRGEQQRPTHITATRGGKEFESANLFSREHDPNLR